MNGLEGGWVGLEGGWEWVGGSVGGRRVCEEEWWVGSQEGRGEIE